MAPNLSSSILIMAINFPISPALNDLYTFTGKTWKWNGFAWDVVDPLTVGLGGSGHLELSTISTNGFSFLTNSTFKQLEIAHTASAVNYPSITGSITGSPVVIQAKGSDTNIGINLVTKGTGTVTINGSPITSGNVNGPASSINNNIAVFDGTTGKLLKDGAKAIADFALLAGATFTGNVNVPSLNTGQLGGHRNKIVNGKMTIAQRGTSIVGGTSGATVYTLDRWTFNASAGPAVTVSQDTDVPSGGEFFSSLKVVVTTNDASIAAGDYAAIVQRIEGYSIRDLVGRTFTISFWVKSAKTGVHCVSFQNSAADRCYVMEYTISAANTWEKKILTVSNGLVTAGTWNYTNGMGLAVRFTLVSGTTYQAAANAWQTGNFLATSNQVNVIDTVSNVFSITGVQLEVGTVATPFEHLPPQIELALCQRYYSRWTPTATAQIAGTGYISGTTVAQIFIPMPVEMRIPVASVETSGTAADYYVLHQNTTATSTVVPGISSSGTKSVRLQMTTAAVLTVGQGAMLYAANTNAFIGFSAEL